MDRTLKRATRRNTRRQGRNGSAWRRFSPDGTHCPYCRHDGAAHLVTSAQPHFYRPATAAERRNPSEQLYRHTPVSSTGQALPQGSSVLVKRVTVAKHAELITAFCTACADDLHTHQALCYQRSLAVGEVVGVHTERKDIAVAA